MAILPVLNNVFSTTITLIKQNNTKVTLNTVNTFVDKNIELINNVRSATTTLTANAAATINSVSFNYNNTDFNVTGSGTISGTATLGVTQSGWLESGRTTAISGTAALNNVTIPKVGVEATITGGGARKPTISKQSVPSGVTNAATGTVTATTPSSGVYVAVQSGANTTTLTATPAVSSDGYGTTAQYSATNATTTVGAAASDIYYVPIATGSAEADSASAEISVYTTDGSNAGTNISGIVGTRSNTEPTSGYYLAFSATGTGSSKVSTAGWFSTGALPAATTTAVRYFPITSGSVTITGGGLTAGAGAATLTNKGYYNGSSYDTSDVISLTTSAASGYYRIDASGSGKVSRAAITRTITAGYQPASGATTVISASNNFSSNTTTATYYVKKSTLSTSTVASSNSTTSITVYAGYYPSDRSISVTGMANASTTTSYVADGMNTYFNTGTSSSYNVKVTPYYQNSAGYLAAHSSATNNGGIGYWKIKNVQGTIGGTASKGSATASVTITGDIATADIPTTGNDGTDYWTITPNISANSGSYTPKYTVTSAGWLSSTITAGSAQTVEINSYTGSSLYLPKATYSTSGAKTTISTGGYLPEGTVVTNIGTITPTTSYTHTNLTTYFTTGTASSYNVSITPRYTNSIAGYLTAHTSATNNGGIGYWKIKSASITSTNASVSGTSFTQAKAYTLLGSGNTGGWITSTTITGATFANTPTSGVSYLNISETTGAPIIPSDGYLYINKGYTDNIRISLAKLIPDDSRTTAIAVSHILNGYAAYNNEGTLIVGTIATQGSNGLTIQGKTATVAAGYYENSISKDVATGTASTPNTTITATPSLSIDSATGLITATVDVSTSITPAITAGYITLGTPGTVSASGSDSLQLTTKAATTYNVSTSDRTIAAGTYLTGDQTIRKVTTSNITEANIKSGVFVKVGDAGKSNRIKSVTGTFTNADTVSSGQTAATSGQILTGYSAWVDGVEVLGNMATAAGSVTMNKGNGYCVLQSSTNITTSDSNNSGVSITFRGSGSVSATAAITTAGYAAQTNSFAIGSSTTSNTADLTKYITGVTLTKGKSFSITVPNGPLNSDGTNNSVITFVFTVANDNTGNVTIGPP